VQEGGNNVDTQLELLPLVDPRVCKPVGGENPDAMACDGMHVPVSERGNEGAKTLKPFWGDAERHVTWLLNRAKGADTAIFGRFGTGDDGPRPFVIDPSILRIEGENEHRGEAKTDAPILVDPGGPPLSTPYSRDPFSTHSGLSPWYPAFHARPMGSNLFDFVTRSLRPPIPFGWQRNDHIESLIGDRGIVIFALPSSGFEGEEILIGMETTVRSANIFYFGAELFSTRFFRVGARTSRGNDYPRHLLTDRGTAYSLSRSRRPPANFVVLGFILDDIIFFVRHFSI